MNVVVKEDELSCPTEREAKFELFPAICNNNQECEKVDRGFRCCKLFGSRRCHEGLEKPLEDIEHERKICITTTQAFITFPFSSLRNSSKVSEGSSCRKLLGC